MCSQLATSSYYDSETLSHIVYYHKYHIVNICVYHFTIYFACTSFSVLFVSLVGLGECSWIVDADWRKKQILHTRDGMWSILRVSMAFVYAAHKIQKNNVQKYLSFLNSSLQQANRFSTGFSVIVDRAEKIAGKPEGKIQQRFVKNLIMYKLSSISKWLKFLHIRGLFLFKTHNLYFMAICDCTFDNSVDCRKDLQERWKVSFLRSCS